MALIRFPEGQQRSGSSGGAVYARNRYGAYIRPRSLPVNPNTERQAQVRAVLRNLMIRWNNDLTESQRAAWELYASNVPWLNRLGDEVRLTGASMYLRSGAAAAEAGLPPYDNAPANFSLGESPVLGAATADASADTLTIAYDNTEGWATAVGGALLIYMGAPQNISRSFFRTPFKQAGFVLGAATPPTSPFVASPAPFPIGLNQRIFVDARALYPDGRLSERVRIDFPSVP
jgi:hypothetical protein